MPRTADRLYISSEVSLVEKRRLPRQAAAAGFVRVRESKMVPLSDEFGQFGAAKLSSTVA
jgi:hypothetical protein